jgi:hypothetical protein
MCCYFQLHFLKTDIKTALVFRVPNKNSTPRDFRYLAAVHVDGVRQRI